MTHNKKPNKPSKANTLGEIRIIAGKHRGRKLTVHNKDGLRPTGNRIRETLFNWLQADIHGAHCVDLFTGSGALAFEAISRGAAQVTAIDTDTRNIQTLNQAKADLGETAINIICSDALSWFQQQQQGIDILFIDPPFATDLLAQCLQQLNNHPSLHSNTSIYIEAQKNTAIDIPETWHWYRHKVTGDIQFGLLRQTH